MNFKSYLNLYELLQDDTSSREERRAFGLSHIMVKNRPLEQLCVWTDTYKNRLKKPLLSEIFSSYLYGITLSLVLVSFIFGIVSGVILLSYSGHEPVNVVYFMAMVIFFPLLTMALALVSMFKAHSARSVLVHLSPAYWMEKIIRLLPGKVQEHIKRLKINPLLSNWIIIKRSQLIALFFSIGLLTALLAMVITKDIAFSWSTTLHIMPESFHSFLNTLAFPWREWFPSAVPSLELIEQSHYFRLGDKLSEEMIQHASKLGEWWKFLAFATLFYAIILRLLMYFIASVGLKYALKKSFLTLKGVRQLLRDMNEPMISTHACSSEERFVSSSDDTIQTTDKLDASYDTVQGWAIPKRELSVLNDGMQIITPNLFEVGGGNTLEEDREIINKSYGEVLLYVKAWEPPTMDFMDYLEWLLAKVDKVVVAPVGTQKEGYKASAKAVEIWKNKLSLLKEDRVWLKK